MSENIEKNDTLSATTGTQCNTMEYPQPSPPMMLTPSEVQSEAIIVSPQNQEPNPTPTRLTRKIVGSAQFKLPDGWIVEERPRSSHPTHIDRYYYEPHTKKKFRSLLSVQRHLAGESETPKRKKSKNKNINLIEFLEGNASTAISKSAKKSDTVGSSGKPAYETSFVEEIMTPMSKLPIQRTAGKPSFAGEIITAMSSKLSLQPPYKPSFAEEITTPMSSKHTIQPHACSSFAEKIMTPMLPPAFNPKQSVKPDYHNKTNTEKNKAPVHNLSLPPPSKVNWVLSNPGGFWTPYVDGSAVSESERLKWAEAFVQAKDNDEDNDEVD